MLKEQLAKKNDVQIPEILEILETKENDDDCESDEELFVSRIKDLKAGKSIDKPTKVRKINRKILILQIILL